MKSFVYYTILHSLLGASAVIAAVPFSSLKRVSNSPTVPNRFIVEVDTTANIPNKRAYARVRSNSRLLHPCSSLTDPTDSRRGL